MRWASQRRSEIGESSGGASVTQCVESDTNVMDSTTTKQWKGGSELDKEEGLGQSSGEAEEGGLTLEDLLRLKEIIKKRLEELDDQDSA